MRRISLVMLIVLATCSCTNSESNPTVDAGSDTSDAAQDTEDATEIQPAWRYYSNEGDPQGDCTEADGSCRADLKNLGFYMKEGVINFQISFHAPFPGGSFEVFMIPEDVAFPGYSLQFNGGAFHLWRADCTSLLKHSGCHWTEESIPGSLRTSWPDTATFTFEIPLSALGFASLTDLLVGVAAAPFDIEVTADFTDRYPDGLLVVPTGIRDLQKIPLDL